MVPLNVIWRRARLDAARESHFMMRVLLAKIRRAVRVIPLGDNDPLPLMDNALVVSYRTEFTEYVSAFRRKSCRNIGLFHTADEYGTDDRGFYADVDYVLRHYWFRPAAQKPSESSLGVLWVPNGYGNLVGPMPAQSILPMADRHVGGFFAGCMETRDERQDMVNVVEAAKLPFQVVKTPAFGQGLGPASYTAFLANARFALVPGGNSPETIRLYEALETGAIPIMLRSEFVSEPEALGDPPIVLLERWDDLPAFYERYADTASPAVITELQAKQAQILAWWRQFVARQQDRVAALIDASFGRSSQERSRTNA